MRLAVYTDYAYAREDGQLYAEQAFSLFLAALGRRYERLTLIGRLNPQPDETRYPVPESTSFVALPFYESLQRPAAVIKAIASSIARFWRSLDQVDAVWLFGPHPLSIAFAVLARVRGRRIYLGVRQDLPAYTKQRHPGRRGFQLAAGVLEATYRALARRCPTVVVGPELRRHYSSAPALLEIGVSLVTAEEVLTLEEALDRSYEKDLTLLSVGRLAPEKNPLMLADILAELSGDSRTWRLAVCGEGPLLAALAERLAELGLSDRAVLHGYVPHGPQLRRLYEDSHFLVHSSWTEGLPQVLIEGLAAGLPVVATDVGGIRAAMGAAVTLVPAGADDAAAGELRRLARDEVARGEAIERGLAYARDHTIERELARVAAFIEHPRRPERPEPTSRPNGD